LVSEGREDEEKWYNRMYEESQPNELLCRMIKNFMVLFRKHNQINRNTILGIYKLEEQKLL